MNREATFRAYHPRYGMSKPFRPFVDMLVMFDTFSGTGVARVQNHTVASNPELTWMQSTELEDKNGVKIYESDIVNISEPDEDSCCGNEFKYKARIIWKRHQWMFDDGVYRVLGVYGWTEYSTLSSMAGRCEFEVVGNFHEGEERQ